MANPLRVLIVDDSENDAFLEMQELQQEGFEPTYQQVETLEEMKTALEQKTWDVIISDFQMPKFTGLEVLRLLQEKGLYLPFIIVSDTMSEDIALQAMKAGAHAFFKKKNIKLLVPAVERGLREVTIKRERKKAENYIRKLNQLQMLLLDPGILEKQLKKITDGVVDIFNVDFCRIWLIGQGDRCNTGCVHAAVTEDPHVCRYRDKCLHLVASSGRYTHLDGETHRRVPFGCYKIGGIASGEYPSFLTNDITNDPRVHNHEWAKQLGLVSFAGFQLQPPSGETKGVLALFSQSAISDEEYSLLESISNLAIRVIQTAQAEEALRESEEKHRALIETTDTGYVIIDLAGKVP